MEPVLVLLREAGQHTIEYVVVSLLQMSSFNGHIEKTTFEKYHPITHWLNMELDLQCLFELLCTAVLIDIATPPPLIWAHIRGT